MLAVFINMACVVGGSLAGLFLRRFMRQQLTQAVMTGIGLITLYLGISGALKGQNTIVLIIAIALGAVIGTLLDIDGGIARLGQWVQRRFARGEGTSSIGEGFVTASLLFCIGSMAIVGSLNAGLNGDMTMLLAKSVMDLIGAAVLTVSLGWGVMLSALFVFVFQGGIVLLAGLLKPLLTDAAIREMTCAGSILILGLGLNMVGVTKIKVANYLPAIVLAPAFSLIGGLL